MQHKKVTNSLQLGLADEYREESCCLGCVFIRQIHIVCLAGATMWISPSFSPAAWLGFWMNEYCRCQGYSTILVGRKEVKGKVVSSVALVPFKDTGDSVSVTSQ